MLKVANKLNNCCLRLELTMGMGFSSVIIAAILLGIDLIYITPQFEMAYHGLQYSTLSEAPFDFTRSNSLQYRIFPSFLGYLFFLRGDLFFILPLFFAWLFIATMYFIYRRRAYSPSEALLTTSTIAFSCTLFIQLASPGYTDVIFYYFIFLSFLFIRNILYSSLFYCFALLTHESCLFLMPGLLLYSGYINGQNKLTFLKYAFAYSIAIIPLFVYRYWVSAHITVEYDLSFYFSKKNILFTLEKVIPLLPAGAFYTFKLFWFFPIIILYKLWSKKEKVLFYTILVILIGDFAQLIIAFDITRMLCLGFPAIIISAERLREEWGTLKFTRFVFGLVLFNFLILQYFMSCDRLNPLLPLPYTWLIENI